MGKLFGTDGIRGEANRPPMDGPTGFKLGRSLASLPGLCDRPIRVVLGKDTRLSGDMLESAVAAGIASAGGDVLAAGVIPTPGVAYLTRTLEADAGVMISASHNPFQDNGFKVFSGRGIKIPDEDEAAIEAAILETTPAGPSAPPDPGRITPLTGGRSRYEAFLRDTFPRDLSLQGLCLILDTANGATFETAPAVFAELGAEVEVLHNGPNGRNINAGCGSEDTGSLEARVVKSGADLGLAFDGDGDRLVAVDETGRRLTGDQVLMILARDLKEQGRLAEDILVTTVMSNLGLTEASNRLGIRHHATRVGDRFVLEEMLRLGAVLGGEDSGHMILLEHHTTGDGILSGLQLLACLIRSQGPISGLASVMTVFPQALVNVEVSRKPDLSTLPGLSRVVGDVEAELGDRGRVLVRYSGTQNVCRVMVEGPTPEETRLACERIAEAVRAEIG